jgi:hypothetical protein
MRRPGGAETCRAQPSARPKSAQPVLPAVTDRQVADRVHPAHTQRGTFAAAAVGFSCQSGHGALCFSGGATPKGKREVVASRATMYVALLPFLRHRGGGRGRHLPCRHRRRSATRASVATPRPPPDRRAAPRSPHHPMPTAVFQRSKVGRWALMRGGEQTTIPSTHTRARARTHTHTHTHTLTKLIATTTQPRSRRVRSSG